MDCQVHWRLRVDCDEDMLARVIYTTTHADMECHKNLIIKFKFIMIHMQ